MTFNSVSRMAGTGLVLALLLAGSAGCRRGPTLTMADFLDELTNVTSFCEMPAGRPGMVSSYDRTGGNADGGNLAPPPTPQQVGQTCTEIDGQVYGAVPDELGPIGGGEGYSRIITEGDYSVSTIAIR